MQVLMRCGNWASSQTPKQEWLVGCYNTSDHLAIQILVLGTRTQAGKEEEEKKNL